MQWAIFRTYSTIQFLPAKRFRPLVIGQLFYLMFCLSVAHPAYAADVATAGLQTVDLVTVDKSERKMYLLSGGKIVKEYRVALGANPQGHKQQEGDERTPEGDYTLDY